MVMGKQKDRKQRKYKKLYLRGYRQFPLSAIACPSAPLSKASSILRKGLNPFIQVIHSNNTEVLDK